MATLSEQVYRALLYLYPSDFRRAYGDDMLQLFRDMQRDAQKNGKRQLVSLWGRILHDVITSLLIEHIDKLRPEIMTTIKIDEYELKTCVAKGSTSHIYIVTDPSTQQDVIMKLWYPQDSFDADTLNQEVEAMIALQHQSIPAVYKYVENDEFPYLIMEYIPGDTLLDRLKATDGFLPQDLLVKWGISACDILIHLHQQEPTAYIFRDVKPSNIIVDDVGQLHLIDFGITVPHQVNHKYNLIGTEGYAPPEQYTGEVDVRSDIYALGASLHHLATRVDPRPDKNPQSQVFTFVPVRSVNPALSKSFASVIAKATAYEREDRYSSAAEMKRDLMACGNAFDDYDRDFVY